MKKYFILIVLLLIPSLCFAWGIGGIMSGGAPANDPNAVMGGSRSMYFDNDKTDATYVEEAITSNTDTYTEFWVRFNDVDSLGPNNILYLAWLGDSGEGKSIGRVWVQTNVSTGNVDKMYVEGYNDNESTLDESVAISPAVNTWYQIKCRWDQASGVDSDDGTFKCTFAGGASTGPDTLDTNTLEVDLVRLGSTTTSTVSIDAWFDVWKCGSTDGGSQYHTDTWDTSSDAGDNWDGGETNGADLSVSDSIYYSP